MSLKFGTSAVNTVTYNGNDVKQIVFNGSSAWAKPYTLSVSKGTGVASVTVSRTSTLEPTASTGSVSAGSGTIFHGDQLSVSATASDGYSLGSYTTSYTVSGNISVSVTATPILVAPLIVSSSLAGGTAQIQVRNNNSTTVTLFVQFDDEEVSKTISAQSSITVQYSTTATSLFVAMYFEADGYIDSSATSITLTAPALTAPELISSSFEARTTTDSQYRYEWDALVIIKNNNSVTVTPESTWTVSSGGSTYIPDNPDISSGSEAILTCNTNVTTATVVVYFSATGYRNSSSITVQCGQSGGQDETTTT